MALPSLSSKQVRQIEGLIQGWTTKLTWDLLVKRIYSDFGFKTTRQTLNTYTSIKTSYQDKKQVLRGKAPEPLVRFIKSDIDMAERIAKLEAENKALAIRVERQQAFIAEIATTAKANPVLIELMERVKSRVLKNG